MVLNTGLKLFYLLRDRVRKEAFHQIPGEGLDLLRRLRRVEERTSGQLSQARDLGDGELVLLFAFSDKSGQGLRPR